MANQTIKLTTAQIQKIDKLKANLQGLSNELLLEGDPLDKQVYEVLY